MQYLVKICLKNNLEILQEIPIRHPESAVVVSLRIEFLLCLLGDVGPPTVVWVPGADPFDKVWPRAVFDPDELLSLTEVGHLRYSVRVLRLQAQLSCLSKPHLHTRSRGSL